jgi:inosine/xanthosine triphosphatase
MNPSRENGFLIAVGSANPLKLRAVEETASRVWSHARVIASPVPSGVSANPISNRETIAGASRRARLSRQSSGAEWGVGLEGGMTKIAGDWFTCVWCVIWDGIEETWGGGVHFQLPQRVVRGVLEEGKEIGTCMDELTGLSRTKRKMGAEGILTGGLIDRRAGFSACFIYAAAPRVYPYHPSLSPPLKVLGRLSTGRGEGNWSG